MSSASEDNMKAKINGYIYNMDENDKVLIGFIDTYDFGNDME